jgi:hypothetical protein
MRTRKLPKPWKPIKRRVSKPLVFGEGFQSGTVESELNRRRLRKERRKDEKAFTTLEATRSERERDKRR